jgi:hypothetical protein
MQRLRLLVGIAVLSALGGCGQSAAPVSITVDQANNTEIVGPEVVLTQLFQALGSEDYVGTEPLVDEAQLGLLTAIEVPDATAYFGYERDGLSAQARNNFWSAFAQSMTGLVGAPADDISARIERQFAADGTRFAIGRVRVGVVEISGDFVLRLVDDQWRLDPIATFGGAFVAPIRNWLRVIPPADVGPVSELLRRDADSWRLLGDLQTDENEAGITISSEVADLLVEIGAP